MKHLTINNMTAEAHNTALAKGWHRDLDPMRTPSSPLRKPSTMHVLGWLALVHSEVSEALEEARKSDAYAEMAYRDGDGKPEGFPSELADIVIRVGDICGALGIDLEAAIVEKMAYNRTREQRHGGKLA